MDGGVLLKQAIHAIDLLQWLVGDVETVQASLERRHRDIECESAGALSLQFDSGAVGTVSATTATRGGRDRTEINGTHGSVALARDDIDYVETAPVDVDADSAETAPREIEPADPGWDTAHHPVIEDFLTAIREDREPAVPGSEARTAVDVVLAAYASDIRGETIAVEDVRSGDVPETLSDWEGEQRD